MLKLFKTIIICLIILSITSCTTYQLSRTLLKPTDIHDLPADAPFLKAHMNNGDLYIFSNWTVSAAKDSIFGPAKHYNPERVEVAFDTVYLATEAISLLETNQVESVPKLAPLAVVGVLSGIITAACLANPKACFGSCPTFFVDDYDSSRIVSEGFSSSISPALEATDVDALAHIGPRKGIFRLRMTNEALETHVIRSLNILATPVRPQQDVYQTDSAQLFHTGKPISPLSSRGEEGSNLELLAAKDYRERISLADSTDLATREVIELSFPVADSQKQYGLIISARQSLLSTYLFYQTLSYMGKRAGEWLALLERGNKTIVEKSQGMGKVLGGIEVLYQTADGVWKSAGEINETGPLALDTKMVVLPAGVKTDSLRLRFTRGHWRIDYCGLAEIIEPASFERLSPTIVEKDREPNRDALSALLDPSRHLFTYPGDEYVFYYELPEDNREYMLFLETTGYYLEWMRGEWLVQEDQKAAMEMLKDPAKALRRLAPAYKKLEPEMEEIFWSSRYAK